MSRCALYSVQPSASARISVQLAATASRQLCGTPDVIGYRRPAVAAGMYHRPDLLVQLAELIGSRHPRGS